MAISNTLFLGLTLSVSILASGCTANSDASPTATNRYTTKTIGSDVILTDHKTGLSWTNSSQGCKPLFGKDPAKTIQTAKSFCADLSFAGQTDWRLANIKEMTELETQTDAHGFSLYYKNPVCARVLALKNDHQLTSISTTNKAPAGRDVGNKFPAGTRCVRDK